MKVLRRGPEQSFTNHILSELEHYGAYWTTAEAKSTFSPSGHGKGYLLVKLLDNSATRMYA
jgi:hypothetical protein